MQNNLPYAICLMGPTASGKTNLALELCEKFPFEIISVDSVQIYQGMNIGSSKPHTQILEKTPHHLVDIIDPAVTYSAAQFYDDALKCMSQIVQREKIPLLVGGTMLYFKILQEGISFLPSKDENVRSSLQVELEKKGLESLYHRLLNIDPIIANKLHPTDSQRIFRALEVYEITGKNMSYWLRHQPKKTPAYRFFNVGLLPIETSRAVLHQRIGKRFDSMLEEGLIEEVQMLFTRSDLHLALPALRAVGYRQIWRYLQKQLSFTQMKEQAIAATRQLAKRQLTWLRHWPALVNEDFVLHQVSKKVKAWLE